MCQRAEILCTTFSRSQNYYDSREWITGRLSPENLTQKQKYGI